MLAGATVSANELGYDLDAEHLAAIADGPGADAALHAIAQHLSCRLLRVAVTADTANSFFRSDRRAGRR